MICSLCGGWSYLLATVAAVLLLVNVFAASNFQGPGANLVRAAVGQGGGGLVSPELLDQVIFRLQLIGCAAPSEQARFHVAALPLEEIVMTRNLADYEADDLYDISLGNFRYYPHLLQRCVTGTGQ